MFLRMFKGNGVVVIITLIIQKEVVEMEIAPNISVDPQIHHGAPVITGTRMPVSIVVGSLAGGMSKEEVSREYEITIEQIEAALSFAAELVAKIQAVPLAGD